MRARSQGHDPADTLMREVGAQLRQARLERGADLNDVAQQLRIKPSYLFGIEQGDLSAIPGRTYALGFLRTYADHLGFDGEDLITRIKSTVENLTDRTSLRIRAPMPENRLPATPVVAISLAVIVGIYLGWSYLNRSSQMPVDTVAEVPSDLRPRPIEAARKVPGDGLPTAASPIERMPGATGDRAASLGSAERAPAAPDRLAAPEAGPVEPRGSLAREAPDALSVQPAAGVTATDGLARTGAPPSADPNSNARPEGAAGPTGPALAAAVSPGRAADARVILRARERSWIQVSSVAGDYVVTRTLEPGEAFLVPDRPDVELWTGNAGGLEVIVDGTPVPALAEGGAVRRGVSLDPDRLLQAAQRPR